MNTKVETNSVFFDNVSFAEAVDRIKYLSKSDNLAYVVTPNVDHMQRLAGVNVDQSLIEVYRSAALSLCDSRILDKMLTLKGKKLKEVIPGSTLTQYLFDHVLTADDKILVVGIEPAHILTLRQAYPHLSIAHINPSMGFINRPDEVAELLEEISTVGANYIFLSVGSPRQEILADKMSAIDGLGGVALCVGASVLFVVGAERRAPAIVQKLHLEWAYRILQDPARLAVRYLKNFIALPSIMKSL